MRERLKTAPEDVSKYIVNASVPNASPFERPTSILGAYEYYVSRFIRKFVKHTAFENFMVCVILGAGLNVGIQVTYSFFNSNLIFVRPTI